SIRATGNLSLRVAEALCAYCARPFQMVRPDCDRDKPEEGKVEIDLQFALARTVDPSGRERLFEPAVLSEKLRADPPLFGRILAALANVLPHAVVVLIDQAEEIFTQTHLTGDVTQQKQHLELLRQAIPVPGDFKIIVSMRTEYYGRFIARL